MKISFKLTLVLFFVAIIAITPLSFIFLQRSEEIITTKTYNVCYNLALNFSTVAREELLLNTAYEGTVGIINKLKTAQNSALHSAYVINKYGNYVAAMDLEKIGKRISEDEIKYFKLLNSSHTSRIKINSREIIRFEFPIFLEEDDLSSLKLGFVIFEYDEELLYAELNSFKKNIFIISILIFFLIIILSFIISRFFTKNIRILSDSVRIIGEGNLDTRIDINSSDEIGDLAKNFNEMSFKLKVADEHKRALLKSYGKFVPMEFLNFLNKNSVIDISLGDQIELEMTILFSDIRSFTSISEKLTAEETFQYINSYLDAMGPHVMNNEGFVDKYIGDAIMAIFPKPINAVKASIDMLNALHVFNKSQELKGFKRTSIGIGIHSGSLILGIVGSELRVQGTVISDAVNLASCLEGLTKVYGATCLISEYALKQIDDKSPFYHRLVDKVIVKGKEKPVDIFEILNGTSQRIINLKLSTREIFESGIQAARSRDFEKAASIFQKVLEIDSADKAARIHYERSLYYAEHGVPPDWSGETQMLEK